MWWCRDTFLSHLFCFSSCQALLLLKFRSAGSAFSPSMCICSALHPTSPRDLLLLCYLPSLLPFPAPFCGLGRDRMTEHPALLGYYAFSLLHHHLSGIWMILPARCRHPTMAVVPFLPSPSIYSPTLPLPCPALAGLLSTNFLPLLYPLPAVLLACLPHTYHHLPVPACSSTTGGPSLLQPLWGLDKGCFMQQHPSFHLAHWGATLSCACA